LVGAGDARQLAGALEAMRRLGAERRSRWGMAGLERVRREFDWERVADQLDALYKRCRAPRRRHGGLSAGSGRPAGMLNRS
jgi:glycosyltransferase involved in cell wall biosynthesis